MLKNATKVAPAFRRGSGVTQVLHKHSNEHQNDCVAAKLLKEAFPHYHPNEPGGLPLALRWEGLSSFLEVSYFLNDGIRLLNVLKVSIARGLVKARGKNQYDTTLIFRRI